MNQNKFYNIVLFCSVDIILLEYCIGYSIYTIVIYIISNSSILWCIFYGLIFHTNYEFRSMSLAHFKAKPKVCRCHNPFLLPIILKSSAFLSVKYLRRLLNEHEMQIWMKHWLLKKISPVINTNSNLLNFLGLRV